MEGETEPPRHGDSYVTRNPREPYGLDTPVSPSGSPLKASTPTQESRIF